MAVTAPRTNWKLRGAAIRGRLITPHSIPCRLVKNADGSWSEGVWAINPHTGEYI